MKKLALVAGVLTLGAGVAFASSLTVPFFLDNAPVPFNTATGNQQAAFIALHNNLSVDIEVSVDYFDAGGDGTVDQQTPSPNTFNLPANATFSFRPVADDSGAEASGAVVPNMPGGEKAGTVIVSWVGGSADIQGRMFEIRPGASIGAAYLLPQGF